MFPLNARPPDPRLVGAGWEAMWQEGWRWSGPGSSSWLTISAATSSGSTARCARTIGAIQCPVYLVGGWADGYTNSVLRLMAGLTCPSKALIGPWGHQYPHQVAAPGR